jgi:hypothetical protein
MLSMQRDDETGLVTVRYELQQTNAESGRVDTVVAGEITASTDEWLILARSMIEYLS